MSKHEREKQHQVDADYSLEAVPTSARKGFWNMFFVMLGFTFFSASMSVGAKLGNGLDLSGFAEYRYTLWLSAETDPRRAMAELTARSFDACAVITG